MDSLTSKRTSSLCVDVVPYLLDVFTQQVLYLYSRRLLLEDT